MSPAESPCHKWFQHETIWHQIVLISVLKTRQQKILKQKIFKLEMKSHATRQLARTSIVTEKNLKTHRSFYQNLFVKLSATHQTTAFWLSDLKTTEQIPTVKLVYVFVLNNKSLFSNKKLDNQSELLIQAEIFPLYLRKIKFFQESLS